MVRGVTRDMSRGPGPSWRLPLIHREAATDKPDSIERADPQSLGRARAERCRQVRRRQVFADYDLPSERVRADWRIVADAGRRPRRAARVEARGAWWPG